MVVIARDQTKIDGVVKALATSTGGSHGGFAYDISSTGLFPSKDFEYATNHKMASTDILVNCAGISQQSLLMRTPYNTIDSVIGTNLMGTILMCKAFIKPMMMGRRTLIKDGQEGTEGHVRAGNHSGRRLEPRHIINFSSILAHRGVAGSSVYSATKSGIEGFSRALAMELTSCNINVNCLSIGLADTPMGRDASNAFQESFKSRAALGVVDPAEVAHSALYLATSKQVTGTVLEIASGYD